MDLLPKFTAGPNFFCVLFRFAVVYSTALRNLAMNVINNSKWKKYLKKCVLLLLALFTFSKPKKVGNEKVVKRTLTHFVICCWLPRLNPLRLNSAWGYIDQREQYSTSRLIRRRLLGQLTGPDGRGFESRWLYFCRRASPPPQSIWKKKCDAG